MSPAICSRVAGACALLGVFGVLMPAWTDDAAKGKKYALLVGVKEYKGSTFPTLRYTENDAEELARVLRKAGFEKVHVLTTTRGKKDPAAQPTAANIKKALAELLLDRGRHDTVLVGLAGHGAEVTVDDPDGKEPGRKYPFFCPHDADLNDVSFSTGQSRLLVSLNDLFARLGKCGAGSKLVLLDACRQELKSESGTRGIDSEKVTIPRGVAALFSCSGGEFAFETSKLGKGHGVFFYHVIAALEGEAKNGRGEVTFAAMAEYVVDSVSDKVPTLIERGAKQTPHRMINFTGKSPVLAVADGRPDVPEKDGRQAPVVRGPSGTKWSNDLGMAFVLVGKGKFRMGSPAAEKARSADEEQHDAEITRDFYLGAHEVTQKQYRAVTKQSAGHFRKGSKGEAAVEGLDTDDFPVESVSYEDAASFLAALNARDAGALGGWRYVLPTEAQWEYACRGGPESSAKPFHFAEPSDSLSWDQANFDGKVPYGEAKKGASLGRPTKVGSYPPNRLGLYDMHGNVREWCRDWYGSAFEGNRRDPTGPLTGSSRVVRGGSWLEDGHCCRAAIRNARGPSDRSDNYVGFRIALVAGGE